MSTDKGFACWDNVHINILSFWTLLSIFDEMGKKIYCPCFVETKYSKGYLEPRWGSSILCYSNQGSLFFSFSAWVRNSIFVSIFEDIKETVDFVPHQLHRQLFKKGSHDVKYHCSHGHWLLFKDTIKENDYLCVLTFLSPCFLRLRPGR